MMDNKANTWILDLTYATRVKNGVRQTWEPCTFALFNPSDLSTINNMPNLLSKESNLLLQFRFTTAAMRGAPDTRAETSHPALSSLMPTEGVLHNTIFPPEFAFLSLGNYGGGGELH